MLQRVGRHPDYPRGFADAAKPVTDLEIDVLLVSAHEVLRHWRDEVHIRRRLAHVDRLPQWIKDSYDLASGALNEQGKRWPMAKAAAARSIVGMLIGLPARTIARREAQRGRGRLTTNQADNQAETQNLAPR